MQKQYLWFGLVLSVLATNFIGCQHSSGAVWEDTKTASRYLNRAFLRKNSDSKMVESSDEFYRSSEEFVALNEEDLQRQYVDFASPQPVQDPGAPGSKSPSLSKFQSPKDELSNVFRMVHFNTDDYVLRVKEYYHIVHRVAQYLTTHSNIYIFVEGNCDDRASEAYNLALGTRRANFVRNLLIKEGVNPERIYTISYGKEKPLASGISKSARAKNRRCEFKIFDKQGLNAN